MINRTSLYQGIKGSDLQEKAKIAQKGEHQTTGPKFNFVT